MNKFLVFLVDVVMFKISLIEILGLIGTLYLLSLLTEAVVDGVMVSITMGFWSVLQVSKTFKR